MKINSSCARQILIECENIPYNRYLLVDDLCNKLMEYSNDDILNVLNFLSDNGYIQIELNDYRTKHLVDLNNKIIGLDIKGIEGLDYIKNDKIWEIMINNTLDSDNLSIIYFIDLAKRIHISNQNKKFNL